MTFGDSVRLKSDLPVRWRPAIFLHPGIPNEPLGIEMIFDSYAHATIPFHRSISVPSKTSAAPAVEQANQGQRSSQRVMV
jgi:hypothetical protein